MPIAASRWRLVTQLHFRLLAPEQIGASTTKPSVRMLATAHVRVHAKISWNGTSLSRRPRRQSQQAPAPPPGPGRSIA
jgi:hypothetical protein